MLVTFHGVRGSTPVPWRRHRAATAATPRACRSPSTGEDPLLFDLGTGLRYFGLGVPAASRSAARPAQPPALGPRAGPAVLQAAAARRSAPRRLRPGAATTGASAAEVLERDDLPAAVPDRRSTGSPAASSPRRRRRSFRIGGFEVESGAVPARRRGPSATGSRTAERASPTSATTSSRSAAPHRRRRAPSCATASTC